MLSVQFFFQFLMLPAMDLVVGQGLHVLLGQRLWVYGHVKGNVIVPGRNLRIGRVVIVQLGRGVDVMLRIQHRLLAGIGNLLALPAVNQNMPHAAIVRIYDGRSG